MSLSILFMMKHPGTARNFEAALRLLAERGHELRLCVELDLSADAGRLLVDLRRDHPGVSIELSPKPSGDRMATLKRQLRLTLDYLRYLEPRYADATKLRARARGAAPPLATRLAGGPLLRHRAGRAVAAGLLREAELALPPSTAALRFIRERRPDVVLVSPLVGLGSRQADYVRAARWLGVPTGLLVHSWDNLTNKGLIRDVPDLVAVWNEAQASEAVELHRVPRERVAVTGAAAYDHWFTWRPSRSRGAFAAEVGLPADRPYALYVCSSPFIAPDEVGFVRRWLAALRGDPRTAALGAVIRPHPQNAAQWRDVKLVDPRAVVWPREGADPVSLAARADFFDSIHHAAAVVGINTSALIESAILSRPVLSVLDDEFRETQGGTLHFEHLAGAAGVLTVAPSLAAHPEQLAALLAPSLAWQARRDRFLTAFVRPAGLDVPAAPRLADAIERLGAHSVTRDALVVRGERLLLRTAQAPLARAVERRRRQAARAAKRRPVAAVPGKGDAVADARAALAALAAHPVDIVLAGPWTSEVGYELLYWQPFLTWALEEHPGLAERLVVVSRGGSRVWYEHLGVQSVDLFDHVAPDELRRRAEENLLVAGGGLRKQMTETPLDRELLELIGGALGLHRPAVLHPSLMYRAYHRHVKRRTLVAPGGPELFAHRRLPAPELGALADALPDEYVAVRFYFRASLPDDAANRRWTADLITALSERIPVVLLNTSLQVDDHWDLELPATGRIVRVDHLMSPSTNLAVQTAVVSRARAFAGTYGGLAYLAPFLGVPSWSAFSEKRFRDHHRELAASVFSGDGFGAFRVDATDQVRIPAIADALAAGSVEHAAVPATEG